MIRIKKIFTPFIILGVWVLIAGIYSLSHSNKTAYDTCLKRYSNAVCQNTLR